MPVIAVYEYLREVYIDRRTGGGDLLFTVLGELKVENNGRTIYTGTPKEREVLAILLLQSGAAISAQTIAERLWDERPPSRGRQDIQSYVSRIRTRLKSANDGRDLLQSNRAGGYRLDVPAELVDFRQFQRTVTRARSTPRSEPEAAVALYREAEALWSGAEPLVGVAGAWIAQQRTRLLEDRRSAILRRIDLELRLDGPGEDAIGELAVLAATEHVDEVAVGLLMRALASAGRVAEALAAYEAARLRLRNDLGVEPRQKLRETHQLILKGEAEPTFRQRTPSRPPEPMPAASTASVVSTAPVASEPVEPPPDNLERDPPYVIGRDEELAAVVTAVERDLQAGQGIAIYGYDGMAGVGKSLLALRAAHILSGHCPDARLQVRLRSHHPRAARLTTRDALAHLLDIIGAPHREMGQAESLDSLIMLWRRSIRGKRILLLLDDVTEAEEIEALLPTSPGSIVLLTSRRRLTGVAGMRQHTLETLTDEAAQALLAKVADRDVAGDGDALARFVAWCGGLPSAIETAAAFWGKRRHWTLADIVERLTTAGHRSGDDQLTGPIDEAFAMSYHSLSRSLRAFVCRLAGHPGPDIGLAAAAAMAEISPASADLALDVLVDNHLVEATARHRYRMHSLFRAFAVERSWHEGTAEDVDVAVGRALDFYLHAAMRADRILRPYRPVIEPPPDPAPTTVDAAASLDLASLEAVRAWLDAERENLAAMLDFVDAHGWGHRAGVLPHVLASHLDRRGHWRRAIDILRRAAAGLTPSLAAAVGEAVTAEDAAADSVEPMGALILMAQLKTDLAALYTRPGKLDQAFGYAGQAQAMWVSAGHRYGEAEVILQIGRIHWLAGRRSEAVEAYRRSAAIFHSVGAFDRWASTESHVGISLFETGRWDEAFECANRVLAAARALNHVELHCDALLNIGKMHLLAGEWEQARSHFEEAEPLAHILRDPQDFTVLAIGMGTVQARQGRQEEALASLQTALDLARSAGDQRKEAEALILSAEVNTILGRTDTAWLEAQSALEIADARRDPLLRSQAHLAVGAVLHRRRRYEEALAESHAALAQAETAQVPLDQARALEAIATILDRVDPASARAPKARAVRIRRRLGRSDPESFAEEAS